MAVTQGLTRDLRRLIAPAPRYVDNVHLAAGGPAKTATVPADASFCRFSATPSPAAGGGDYLVRFDGQTATLPVADVTDGTASTVNPEWLAVTPRGTFSIIANLGAVDVSLAYYGKEDIGW